MKLEICIDSFDGMIGAYFGGLIGLRFARV